jgi:hypothetical protein
VSAAWRLGAQVVTPAGAIIAGTASGLLGNNPRPVFAVAGLLTILTVMAAWAAGLGREAVTHATGSVLAERAG